MTTRRIYTYIIASLIAYGSALAQSAVPSLLVPADAAVLSTGLTAPLSGNHETVKASINGGLWAPATARSTPLAASVDLKLTPTFAMHLDGRYFHDRPYDITNTQGVISNSFAPSDMYFDIGVSYYITSKFALRADGVIISSAIAPSAKTTGFCGSLSAAYVTSSYNAVLAVRNIGPGLDYGGGAVALPTLISAAGSISPLDALRICIEADYLFSGALMAGLGVEYGIADIAFLRAGYHYGDSAKALASYASLGLGLQFAGVSLDLAFLTASKTLGNTLMVGLGYSF